MPASQVTGITGAMIDITASKQVEEALSISEERLRMANEAAHMGAWNSRSGHRQSGMVGGTGARLRIAARQI